MPSTPSPTDSTGIERAAKRIAGNLYICSSMYSEAWREEKIIAILQDELGVPSTPVETPAQTILHCTCGSDFKPECPDCGKIHETAEATPVETASPESRKKYKAWVIKKRGDEVFEYEPMGWTVWQGAWQELEPQLTQVRAENAGLRKRVHHIEKHNQHFERCESAWCNPGTDSNPALEMVKGAVARAEKAELELTQVREELRQADAEIAEARNEASTCDDIVLNQSLAGVIGSLQKDRERLQCELGKAEAENKLLAKGFELLYSAIPTGEINADHTYEDSRSIHDTHQLAETALHSSTQPGITDKELAAKQHKASTSTEVKKHD